MAGRMKFIIGGLIVLAAIIFLIFSSTQAHLEYFYTVDQVITKGDEVIGKKLRVSGVVIGDSVQYYPESLTLKFEIAHIPGDVKTIESSGGLARVLHDAVQNPLANHLSVVYVGVKPDLLQNEAQVIMTGYLGEDGLFHADELLLKCPTRYEDSVPGQADPID